MATLDLLLANVAFVLGLVVGSFLNVVIYRVPRHESVVHPGSHCPSCGHGIRWYDNIPLVSYLILRGRCRDCGAHIPWRYPAVEVAAGLLFVTAALVFGIDPRLLLAWAFLAVLLAISLIDLEHYVIPDRIVLPAAVVGLAASIALDPSRWWVYIVSGLGAALFLFILALIWPGGMGMGDVKMALLMGVVLGPTVIIALFVAFLAGALVSIVLLALRVKSRKDKIPFGPYLALGAALSLLWGASLLDTYLNLY